MKGNFMAADWLAAAFTVAIIASGCSTASNSNAAAVQDCGIVAISSPPKYACGGKVYTAFQLAKIRGEQAQKYQSGK